MEKVNSGVEYENMIKTLLHYNDVIKNCKMHSLSSCVKSDTLQMYRGCMRQWIHAHAYMRSFLFGAILNECASDLASISADCTTLMQDHREQSQKLLELDRRHGHIKIENKHLCAYVSDIRDTCDGLMQESFHKNAQVASLECALVNCKLHRAQAEYDLLTHNVKSH